MTIPTRESYLAQLVALLARIEIEQGYVDHALEGFIAYKSGSDLTWGNPYWNAGEHSSEQPESAWDWHRGWGWAELPAEYGIIDANDRRAQE